MKRQLLTSILALALFLFGISAVFGQPIHHQYPGAGGSSGWSLAGIASWSKLVFQYKMTTGYSLPATGDPYWTPEGMLYMLASTTANPVLYQVEGQVWKKVNPASVEIPPGTYATPGQIPNNASFTLSGLGEKAYSSLTGKPSIPNNASFTLFGLAEKSYSSLTGLPIIPQVPNNASFSWVGLSDTPNPFRASGKIPFRQWYRGWIFFLE